MGPSGRIAYIGLLGHVNAGLIQELYLGRAPRTKETLPDFLKWRRVTRPPLVFRGLTGSQRTPEFWGVTEDDQGTRPNSSASVEGGQASHAPPMNEPEQVAGGTMGVLQQLVQALQRAGQLAAITSKRSAIERMARYRPVDFMGKKEDEPSMAENWL